MFPVSRVATANGATVAEQTRAALETIEANSEEAGSDKHHILEPRVYLTDMRNKSEMDAAWCDWIPDEGWPCRACVGADLAPSELLGIKGTAAK